MWHRPIVPAYEADVGGSLSPRVQDHPRQHRPYLKENKKEKLICKPGTNHQFMPSSEQKDHEL